MEDYGFSPIVVRQVFVSGKAVILIDAWMRVWKSDGDGEWVCYGQLPDHDKAPKVKMPRDFLE